MKLRKVRIFMSLAAGLLCTGLSTIAIDASSAGATKAPIIIGAVLAQSGIDQNVSGPGILGLKTVAIEQNNRGGLFGRKIEIDAVDSASSPTTAAIATQQLLSEDHPVGAEIDSVAALQDAMLPYFAAAKVPTIMGSAPVPTYQQLYSLDPYDYEDYPADPALSAATNVYAVKAAAGKQPVKLAILYDTETQFIQRYQIIEQTMGTINGTIVASQQIPQTAVDATTAITQLKGSGANVLLLLCGLAPSLTAFNAINALQWNVKIVGSTSIDAASVLNPGALPSFIANNLQVFGLRYLAENPNTGGVESQFRTAFHDLVKFTGPISSDVIEMGGYEAAGILISAMKDAGVATSAGIVKALNNHFVVPPQYDLNGEPDWTSTIHTMQRVNLSQAMALIHPGTEYLGAYPGVYITTPPKRIPTVFFNVANAVITGTTT